MKNWQLHQSLRARGLNLKVLGAELGMRNNHLSMVFNGRRGGLSRKRIAQKLTPAELELLGWTAAGELLKPKPAAAGAKTNSHV